MAPLTFLLSLLLFRVVSFLVSVYYGISVSETSFGVTASDYLSLLALGALCPQGS